MQHCGTSRQANRAQPARNFGAVTSTFVLSGAGAPIRRETATRGHYMLLLPLLLLPLAAAPSVPAWLSMFNPDFDAAEQHRFANLGMSGNLTQLVEAHAMFGMQGMMSIQDSGVWKATPAGHKNQNETGLLDGWEGSLSAVLTAAEPHLRSGAVVGVFLGDERCVSQSSPGVSCINHGPECCFEKLLVFTVLRHPLHKRDSGGGRGQALPQPHRADGPSIYQ